MATTQIADVIVPAKFTEYIVVNSMERTALVQSGVAKKNSAMLEQLTAGAQSFTVPFWLDLASDEADIVSDNPATLATPKKLTAGKQVVRKAFLHQGWAAMNLASELSGSDPLVRIQDRAVNYWDRQMQRRLIASLQGIQADNVATNAGDMQLDISGLVGALAKFSASAVIDCASTLGDGLEGLTAIGMHSAVLSYAMKNDMIATVPQSEGKFIKTFRGLAVIVDDGLPVASGNYTTVLFGPGAIGYAVADPRIAPGTEIENQPSAGNGGGQQTLHSRINAACHPLGFTWKETTVAGNSPTIAELRLAANWGRVVTERKSVPLAFLVSKI